MMAQGGIIEGRCWVFDDDVDTDIIIPARYVAVRDPERRAKLAEMTYGQRWVAEAPAIIVGDEVV